MKFYLCLVGPAGSGKSTLSSAIKEHYQIMGKHAYICNLDFGAESLSYQPEFDIRQLYTVRSVMEKQSLGFNGALMWCYEQLADKIEWLLHEFSGLADDSTIIIDTPGQAELIMHNSFLRSMLGRLEIFGGRCCLVCCIESVFAESFQKRLVGGLLSVTSSLMCQIPSITVFTKSDLFKKTELNSSERVLDETTSDSSNSGDCEDDTGSESIQPSDKTYTKNDDFATAVSKNRKKLIKALNSRNSLHCSGADKLHYISPRNQRLARALNDVVQEFGILTPLKVSIHKPPSISRLFNEIEMLTQSHDYLDVQDKFDMVDDEN